MTLMTFVGAALVALLAGFVYNWLVPQVTPHLPSTITSNMILSSIATGVFILVTIGVAHFVAKALLGKRNVKV